MICLRLADGSGTVVFRGCNMDVRTQQSEQCFLCCCELVVKQSSSQFIVLLIRSCLVCCGCKWEIGGALGGRAGHSVINVPIAVIIRLMASLSDGMLGARPQGARHKRLQASTPLVINSARLLTKNLRPPDNVFHGSAILQGFPPAWP